MVPMPTDSLKKARPIAVSTHATGQLGEVGLEQELEPFACARQGQAADDDDHQDDEEDRQQPLDLRLDASDHAGDDDDC